MPEIILPSTKDAIGCYTAAECETALKKLYILLTQTQDPDQIIKYKLCKTRLESRLIFLKSVI